MCYGYHAHLSKQEQKEMLEQRKKILEARLRQLDEALQELQPEPARQNA